MSILIKSAGWVLRWPSRLYWISVGFILGFIFAAFFSVSSVYAADGCFVRTDASCSMATADFCWSSAGCSWSGTECVGTLDSSVAQAYADLYCLDEISCNTTCGGPDSGFLAWSVPPPVVVTSTNFVMSQDEGNFVVGMLAGLFSFVSTFTVLFLFFCWKKK